MEYTVYVDGGCKNNQTSNLRKGYGSFLVEDAQERPLAHETFEFGKVTNNEAEYLSVIKALEWVAEHTTQNDKIRIFTDSALVRMQSNGFYRVKKSELKPLNEKVKGSLTALNCTRDIALYCATRKLVVEKLGH